MTNITVRSRTKQRPEHRCILSRTGSIDARAIRDQNTVGRSRFHFDVPMARNGVMTTVHDSAAVAPAKGRRESRELTHFYWES